MYVRLLRRFYEQLPSGLARTLRNALDYRRGKKPLGLVVSPSALALAAEQTDKSDDRIGRGLGVLARASRMQKSAAGYGSEYDLVSESFDHLFYLATNTDVARQGLDPVAHYLRGGVAQGRNPTPWFDTRAYAAVHKDAIKKSWLSPFGYWLKFGRELGHSPMPVAEFDEMCCQILEQEPADVGAHLKDYHADLRNRLLSGTLGEMVQEASELDPLIALSWPSAMGPRVPPFNQPLVAARTMGLFETQKKADWRTAKTVIVVNRPRWGGGRRMEGYMAHALAEIYGASEVVVLTTEEGGKMPPNKLPDGVRVIDFSDIAFLRNGRLESEMRERVLFEFLRSLRADAIFNVNSRLFWEMLTPYGNALAADTRIVCALFCNEKTPMGHWTGYPVNMFYRHFEKCHTFCTDSTFLAGQLSSRWQLPEDQQNRLRVLSAPVDTSINVSPGPSMASGRRPQIYWSGRLDPQKRPDLVLQIAALMPDADFHMWGAAHAERSLGTLVQTEANVFQHPTYKQFSELDLSQADVWLYTAAWDGVPSILLEVAMTGLPIVGTDVGGTGEVIRKDLAWPIPETAMPEDYVAALRSALEDTKDARVKALQLREELIAERTEQAYREVLQDILAEPLRGKLDIEVSI